MKFEIEETKINGLPVTVYEAENPIGTIIMINGYGGYRSMKYRIRRAGIFAENGFKVITWDYRSFVSKEPTLLPNSLAIFLAI